MNKIDIAQQLAMITGKNINSFFKEDLNEEREGQSPIEQSSENTVQTTRDGHMCVGAASTTEEKTESTGEIEVSEELKQLAKQYDGKIYNNCILENKIQMSRKDYLSISKKLTHKQLLEHPLLYVMFRSEGQGDANFFEWTARFKDEH